MATLSVQIDEKVTLNGRDFGQTRTTSVTGVNTIDTRVFVATSTEMDLIKFDSAAGAGQFVDGAVKYLRISHLSGADDLHVRVVGTTRSTQQRFRQEVASSFLTSLLTQHRHQRHQPLQLTVR